MDSKRSSDGVKNSNTFCFTANVLPKSAWVQDEQASHCHSCTIDFGLVMRRHHCRLCGQVYCNDCCDIFISMKSLQEKKMKSQEERSCWSCLLRLNQTQLSPSYSDFFINIRNVPTYYRTWLPPTISTPIPTLIPTPAASNSALGLIILIHGLNDHSGRFSRFSAFLNKEGFVVCAMDLPGHGRSQKGNTVYFDSNDDPLNDLTLFVQLLKSHWLNLPVFILGTGFVRKTWWVADKN
eukprot:TRINITY_DN9767_c0_g2_i1.p1 TRINITY_DN9767_c0_g2~~TRINITY_DN9767_c0_g2_i1.p1  ORF type:complete len:237 (-),score=23.87 TRINITY_DN9767_c0_g2_i1:30-740(-)